ncbi:hypothetical protein OGAPHI_002674 [Ogataea philodendri]|uniref:Uncharacterized protein n=1 Tax=Ogataea philodendri TaxID=1378263 RepID=A0A9P8PCF7_9ASCO|nr:uncharacterized protein OGAPHI_002674 [Ogataea philodendri]KAH3668919.1 hypothetical protein OGAPHI_002674 [Ogataea philodendri]
MMKETSFGSGWDFGVLIARRIRDFNRFSFPLYERPFKETRRISYKSPRYWPSELSSLPSRSTISMMDSAMLCRIWKLVESIWVLIRPMISFRYSFTGPLPPEVESSHSLLNAEPTSLTGSCFPMKASGRKFTATDWNLSVEYLEMDSDVLAARIRNLSLSPASK